MLGRIATGLMLRHWALAAAGVGLVVMFAIATAPKPTCHCAGTPAMAMSEPTTTAVRVSRDCTNESADARDEIRGQVIIAQSLSTPPRDAYLALMDVRTLDCTGEYTAVIDRELARVATRASVGFMAVKDYQNAASAVMVAKSLGVANSTTQAVEQSLQYTPYPRD